MFDITTQLVWYNMCFEKYKSDLENSAPLFILTIFAIILNFYHEYDELLNKISDFKFGFAKDNSSELTIIIKCSDKIFMSINELSG